MTYLCRHSAINHARPDRATRPDPSTMRFFLFFFAVLTLAACSFTPPTVPVAHQACNEDTECVLIQLECSDCDCGKPINKDFVQVYENEKRNRCLAYSGPVCDVLCPTTTSVCRNNKCVR